MSHAVTDPTLGHPPAPELAHPPIHPPDHDHTEARRLAQRTAKRLGALLAANPGVPLRDLAAQCGAVPDFDPDVLDHLRYLVHQVAWVASAGARS